MKQKSMEQYREEINHLLKMTRSKTLHRFVYEWICVYFCDPDGMEQGMKNIYEVFGKDKEE